MGNLVNNLALKTKLFGIANYIRYIYVMLSPSGHTHDRFFILVFSVPSRAAVLLRGYLPPEFAALLDLAELVPSKDSFLDRHLSQQFSDLVFTCKFSGQDTEVRVTILFEHKSYKPSRNIYFQLNQYMLNIWEKQQLDKLPFSPVILVVVYHGTEKWDTRPLSEMLMPAYPSPLLPLLPRFDFYLINLQLLTDEEIESRSADDPLVWRSLLAMKHILFPCIRRKVLILLDPEGFDKSNDFVRSFFHSFILYLYQGSKRPNQLFMNTLERQLLEWGYEEGSPIDISIRKGERKGLLRGKIEGKAEGKVLTLNVLKLHHKGMGVPEISEKTGATAQEVQDIIDKFNSDDDL